MIPAGEPDAEAKPRQVLITEADLPRVLAALGEPAASASD